VKDSLFDHTSVPEMLDDNTLEQRRRHSGVPDAVGIYDDDRPTTAHPETWRLTALHALRTKQQTLAL
jgi:hypothetical protein